MLLTLGRMGIGHNAINDSAPFNYDADTYWWDFTSTENTIDTVGDDTISYAPEQLAGLINLEQTTKDYQPLLDVNGSDFGNASNRELLADTLTNVLNGATGVYIAGNARWDTANGGVVFIDSSPDLQMYLSASRKLGIKLNGSWKIYSNSLTLGQWYSFEFLIDTVSDDITYWQDGVETTPQYEDASGLATFASSDPLEISVGHTVSSLDGVLQNLIVYSGIPSTEIRSSISSYLSGVRS